MPVSAARPVDAVAAGVDTEWPSLAITSGDGKLWVLTDPSSSVQVQPGWSGFDLAPVTLYVDDTPALPGGSYQGYHDDVKPLFLPVYTTGEDRADTLAKRRAFLTSIHPSRGPVTITKVESDGRRRHIDAIYSSGAEGIEAPEQAGLHWAVYGLNFQAVDEPYWYGEAESAGPWRSSNPQAFYPLKPYLFQLSGSQVLGSVALVNEGDVDAYPVWTLHGPASALTLTLGTRVFRVAAPLLVGETLTIDTHPGVSTVLNGAGANLWPLVADSPQDDLWTLPPGGNGVSVAVEGGGAATSLTMTYTPRYLVQ